jgi:DNA-directed RNA polymerase specialized sigma24 family protein
VSEGTVKNSLSKARAALAAALAIDDEEVPSDAER